MKEGTLLRLKRGGNIHYATPDEQSEWHSDEKRFEAGSMAWVKRVREGGGLWLRHFPGGEQSGWGPYEWETAWEIVENDDA